MHPLFHARRCVRGGTSYDAVLRHLESGHAASLTTVAGCLPALVVRSLSEDLASPIVVVVPDLRSGHDFVADVRATGSAAVLLPPLDADPYSGVSAHPDTLRSRIEALSILARPASTSSQLCLVAPARSLAVPLPPPTLFASWILHLKVNAEYDVGDLRENLAVRGYVREDTVASRGEFASRGYILDVFPVDAEVPLRLEFFGDTLTTIRPFDPATQRSLESEWDALALPPMREFAVDEKTGARWAEAVSGGNAPAMAAWTDELRMEGNFAGYELMHWTEAKDRANLDDYLPDAATVVVEPEACRAQLESFYVSLSSSFDTRDAEALPPPSRYLEPEEEARRRIDEAALHLNALGREEGRVVVEMASSPSVRYEGDIGRFFDDVSGVLDNGGSVGVMLETRGSLDRFWELLQERDFGDRVIWKDGDPDQEKEVMAGRISIGLGRVARGFQLDDGPVLFVADRDLHAGTPRRREPRRTASMEGFLSDLRDLKEGDLVVHTDHGIGRYCGVQTMPGPAGARDFLVLAYRGDDKLYQPLERLDVVQKYSGVAGVAPRVDKLGGASWTRVKSKIRADMREMTKELLELYAQRMASKGHRFDADQPWQTEFEESFPYTETPDQAQAITDTKKDMESARPMDRLVVGDVGYGKTEVAMRAAMKAVLGGKQVAVLAPTTVLTFQHHRTFSARFSDYPVRIDLLSRFRSKAEQKLTIAAIANGEVDVVIGTHRILSKDVEFQQLGLLIVDEEQRFGVRHKERLKELKKDVDVLTLTATPIPRTLQMALGGLRDLSLIRTPPAGRYAVQTEVLPFRRETVRLAIQRELERAGQVYFVHNRIGSIYSLADMVRELAPHARTLVAHGQMSEGELEETILAFVRGEADILVTTTIIENGVDIPRVNTIIVNRADQFGLAQLYQLRGRVGRSDERAYAYLLVPSLEGISDVARKRLRALKEFSQLGSGFRLAAMDLEIRGAGSLLGAQQSGHIAAIGFEMYCRLLEQTAAELRGEEVVEDFDAKVSLPLDLHLPETYVPDQGERLAVYKRIVSASDADAVKGITEEVVDRYGHPPDSLRNLTRVARIRILASRLQISAIETAGRRLVFRFPQQTRADLEALVGLLGEEPGATLSPQGVLEVPLGDRDPGLLALDLLQALD